jgi:flavin reductase (DIM6/NTAB) family NADH-FMN oxidoreductase RutF
MKKSIGPQTLPMPAPVWVIGTYDRAGRPNVMTASWAGICCSRPPCIAVSIRPACCTHDHIMERKAFTISVPSAPYAQAADYFGLVSGRDADKFAVAGLTAARSECVDAPYVQEFPVVLECSLRHSIVLGSHTQFVGEIVDIKVEDSVLMEPSGQPDPEKVGAFVLMEGYRLVGTYLGSAFSIGKNPFPCAE